MENGIVQIGVIRTWSASVRLARRAGKGVFLILFIVLSVPSVAVGGDEVKQVTGGRPIPREMRAHPERFFPIYSRDDTLNILEKRGFYVFDDFDHHRDEIEAKTGLHVRFAKIGINIPRRCFWVTYNFWEKRGVLRRYLPPALIRSMIDMAVKDKNDEMGGILCLRDMKTGIFYLGFGMFTLRKRFSRDNSVAGRTMFRDYVALKRTTPRVARILKEALEWIVAHKRQLTETYWEPLGKRLVAQRNAKL